MRKVWSVWLGICLLILGSCERKNFVYSNASLNKPYTYDPRWDYRGYSSSTSERIYRTYDPDRQDEIVKNLEEDYTEEEGD